MRQDRRTFIKNAALAGGCAFASLSSARLLGMEGTQCHAAEETPHEASFDYLKTLEIIKRAYGREIQAHIAYTKFSKKALEKEYPNIAYLFESFALAESIHARNFKNVLMSLGEQPSLPEEKFEVLSTRKNLDQALQLELMEISIYYPNHLKSIKEEEHWNAIAAISHALASEKQHESLLRKMKKGTGIFWNMLKKRIEGEDVIFCICRVCGSTLTAIPDICPICGKPNSFYEKVERHKCI